MPRVKNSTGTQAKARTRRETILSLVEQLLQADGDDFGLGQQSTVDDHDEKDDLPLNEHLEKFGAKAFDDFERKVVRLDQELSNFSVAARRMGGSAAIIFFAPRLQTRLANLLFLYQCNAAQLYPHNIQHPAAVSSKRGDSDSETSKHPPIRRTPRSYSKHGVLFTLDPDTKLDEFPAQFRDLGEEVAAFLSRLNDIPDFVDGALTVSMSSFESDLRYWADCLQEYRGQFRHSAVQRYVQEMSLELGVHIDNITSALSSFIAVGIPTVYSAQKYATANLLNLSTFTTFFSVLTATGLQMSFELPNGWAVNSFWFASLVFSVSAAINGLLALRWKRAIYRSPEHRVPWWILIWMNRSPFIFLVLSVVCFTIGLSLFAFASGQSHFTLTVTTALNSCSSFGTCTLTIAAWFALERWVYSIHRGKKWLGDIIFELRETLFQSPIVSSVRRALMGSQKWISARTTSSSNIQLRRVRFTESYVEDIEGGLSESYSMLSTSNMSRRWGLEAGSIPLISIPGGFNGLPVASGSGLANSFPPSVSVGKQLWKNAIRTVKMHREMSQRQRMPSNPKRQRMLNPKRATTNPPFKAKTQSRVNTLIPKLGCLQLTQETIPHQAMVAHLQFSPDGQFLASSGWDRIAVIFRLQESVLTHHRTLGHAKGFADQIAWSPTGLILLAKQSTAVKVWTQPDGVCKQTIERHTSVESIVWFPGGEAFLSVEGSLVVKLSLEGKILDSYGFGSMTLQAVGVTPDGLRLLGVGSLPKSPNGIEPSRSRAENRLTGTSGAEDLFHFYFNDASVYNMETSQMEHITPVLDNVKGISLTNTRDGILALVSYKGKVSPQLWKLQIGKNTARLQLRQVYNANTSVDFVGSSYFGGKNDELVLCAGNTRDIHIWDRDSGILIHHIRAQHFGEDLACIAWNHAAENPFMFATGGHDGRVQLWTKPEEERIQESKEQQPQSILEDIPLLFTRSTPPLDVEESQRTKFVEEAEFAELFAKGYGKLQFWTSLVSVNLPMIPVVTFLGRSDTAH
ncbi:hypothetical protein D9757_013441 [Collybiopsis confluens]|uniref:WD40 repeat-like protein n=1 Tax=Collybiopsis confluens TaxID=2823264 RepID=A0A8H5CPI4_9AGAR|nr:hypothetical protein D9757_013441 [Collybiopsis confluens]